MNPRPRGDRPAGDSVLAGSETPYRDRLAGEAIGFKSRSR
jgi:hypothetical protein